MIVIVIGPLDPLAIVDLTKGGCPDCGGRKFHPGPRAGFNINVKCAGCGHCFNCSPVSSHRIEETPGVYSPEVRTLPEMALDELTRLSEELGLYDLPPQGNA